MTRKVDIDSEHHVEFPDYCAYIVQVCAAQGWEITPAQAERLWREYSTQEYCAGFLGLPADTDLYKAIKPYLKKYEVEPSDAAAAEIKTDARTLE